MVLNTKSLTKLASLSAAGAGVLAFGAKTAQAAVVDSGIINQKVGFDSGFGTSYTSPGLGTAGSLFTFTRVQSSPNIDTHKKVLFGGSGVVFKACSASCAHTLRVFAAGATWSSVGAGAGHANNGLIATLIGRNLTAFPSLGGNRAFTDQYALIQFTSSGVTPLYGWIELTLVDNDRPGPPAYGPDLTIERFAYDDTGAKLAAGSLSSPTPEPGTLATTGLAALALGATGLRRWRAQKAARRA